MSIKNKNNVKKSWSTNNVINNNCYETSDWKGQKIWLTIYNSYRK